MSSFVWMDGALMPADQAHVSTQDRGLTLGDGLFETMLWTGDSIRFARDHLNRLSNAATNLHFELPMSLEAIHGGLIELGSTMKGQMAAIRLTLTRGVGPRGLGLPPHAKPRLFATIADCQPPTSEVALQTIDIRRNPSAPSTRYKTLSYIDNIMALADAQATGADDGIMLGTNGNVACTTSANVMLLLDGAWYTPDRKDGAFGGIVRGRLIEAGRVIQAPISPQVLAKCDEAVITNALIGIRPVASIDGRVLPSRASWLRDLLPAIAI